MYLAGIALVPDAGVLCYMYIETPVSLHGSELPPALSRFFFFFFFFLVYQVPSTPSYVMLSTFHSMPVFELMLLSMSLMGM